MKFVDLFMGLFMLVGFNNYVVSIDFKGGKDILKEMFYYFLNLK